MDRETLTEWFRSRRSLHHGGIRTHTTSSDICTELLEDSVELEVQLGVAKLKFFDIYMVSRASLETDQITSVSRTGCVGEKITVCLSF